MTQAVQSGKLTRVDWKSRKKTLKSRFSDVFRDFLRHSYKSSKVKTPLSLKYVCRLGRRGDNKRGSENDRHYLFMRLIYGIFHVITVFKNRDV